MPEIDQNAPRPIDVSVLENIRNDFSVCEDELTKVFSGSIGTHQAEVSPETQVEANLSLMKSVEREILGSLSAYDVPEIFCAAVHDRLESLGLQHKPITGTEIAQVVDGLITDLRTEETVVNNLVEHIHSGALTLAEAKEAAFALLGRKEVSKYSAVSISQRLSSWYRSQYGMFTDMKETSPKREVLAQIDLSVQAGQLTESEAERLLGELYPEGLTDPDSGTTTQTTQTTQKESKGNDFVNVRTTLLNLKNEGYDLATLQQMVSEAVDNKTITFEEGVQLNQELSGIKASTGSQPQPTTQTTQMESKGGNFATIRANLLEMKNMGFSVASLQMEVTAAVNNGSITPEEGIRLNRELSGAKQPDATTPPTAQTTSRTKTNNSKGPNRNVNPNPRPVLSEADRQVLQFGQIYIDKINGELKKDFPDEEVRNNLIEKLSRNRERGGVHTFAKDFFRDYKNATEEVRLAKIQQEYEELAEFAHRNRLFNRMMNYAKANVQRFVPNNNQRLVARFLRNADEQGPFIMFMSASLRGEHPLSDDEIVQNYLENCIIQARMDVQEFDSTPAYTPINKILVTKKNPGVDTIAPGTVFGQHANTCFMVAPINALCATKEGALYVQQWMKNFSSMPTQKNSSFSDFEQRLGTIYKARRNDNIWNLGKMGFGNEVLPILGLDNGLSLFPGRDRDLDNLCGIWTSTTKALRAGQGVVLHTPGHYRAIVGSYGKPSNDPSTFGFIVRDSIGQYDTEVSMQELSKSDSTMIMHFTRPNKPPMPRDFGF